MTRVHTLRLLSLAALASLVGCSGSGGGATGTVKTGGDFLVLKSEPSDNGRLYLNDAIELDFSNEVDLNSVNLNTFTIQVLDQVGNTVAEPVAGLFSLATSPGDTSSGRRLRFTPRLPTNDLYTNGGFRPGRTYVVQLVGGDRVSGTVLLDKGGRALERPQSFRFSTSSGTSPSELFRNTVAGGPRRIAVQVTPSVDNDLVALSKIGGPPVEVRITFDQPLNPASSNVPTAVDTNPLTRSSADRGRIFLEYDDFVFGQRVWIPADVELESNTLLGSTVVLRPLGVLPNNATIRVIVESQLEDISGESNVPNSVAYERIVGTFRTQRAYESQFACLVADFGDSDQVDFTAAFPEPTAEVGPGYLKAGFQFEGSTTGAIFQPSAPETILNTDFTTVTPINGPAFNVSGGVFNFQSVLIPSGKVVRGQGSHPMVWLVTERFEVAGTLSVNGGQGTVVMSTGNADVPKAGGAGACGGGDGGDGSPSATQRDESGAQGKGPGQLAGGGGRGGSLACTAGCGRGSAGGGGSFASQGDPNFKIKTIPVGAAAPVNPVSIFPQQAGIGGNGCTGAAGTLTRSFLSGGTPGPVQFVDARTDNNFWGVGVRFDSPLRIVGELAVPIGGAGGGGGGDWDPTNTCSTSDVAFLNDASGGGGGGGGGVLIVKCLGPIVIADGGRISADGGHGGGGAQSGSSSRGGGGGGGSGGMVVLMSAQRIEINARGTGTGATARYLYGGTAADTNDFNFSVSADGGACVTDNFSVQGTSIVRAKYVVTGTAIAANFNVTYDTAPLGGYGGMGVVQLMAPAGDNADGTNTRLDDNIVFYRGGVLATAAQKEALIGWRGFPNSNGQGVGDTAQQVFTYNTLAKIDNEGDIRPAPILLPSPFGTKTRLRSNWIDTGATARRSLPFGDDGLPRGVTDTVGNLAGPRYEFAGYRISGQASTGYTDYDLVGSAARPKFSTVIPATPVTQLTASATFLGAPAYQVDLAAPALGDQADRFVGYHAELLSASGSVLGGYRILAHGPQQVMLAVEGVLPAAAASMRVQAKFYEVVTNGVEGLGQTYAGLTGRVPVANVRIGFAFHTDPKSATAARFPAAAGTFTYDLADPAVQDTIRALGAKFVQWDVLFDTAYQSVPGDQPLALRPDTPRPELRFLRVPVRF